MGAANELFDAIRAGDRVRLEALLSADPALASARNERGHSAVLIAQYHHKKDLVTTLLAAGAQLDFWDALVVGATERVAAFLDRDPALLNAYAADGFFPLGLAAYFGHLDTVTLLLARGADVAQAARNPMRVQALHAAVSTRRSEIAKTLLAAGAPVDARQQEGWTPLHGAVRNKDVAMVRLLLAHGADPKQQNEAGKSAIGLAADDGSTEILKLLKRH